MHEKSKTRSLREPKRVEPSPPGSPSPLGNGTDKLERLVQYLEELRAESFTGYVKINYSQGGVGRIERFEEVLKRG